MSVRPYIREESDLRDGWTYLHGIGYIYANGPWHTAWRNFNISISGQIYRQPFLVNLKIAHIS